MKYKHFIALFLAVCLLLLVFCVAPENAQAKKTTFTFPQQEMTLPAGGYYFMELISNKTYAAGDLFWNSSNKKVAKVSQSGAVLTQSPGVVYITVTDGNQTAECRLTVQAPKRKIQLKYVVGEVGNYSSTTKTKTINFSLTQDSILSLDCYMNAYEPSKLAVYDADGDCKFSLSLNDLFDSRVFFLPLKAGSYSVVLKSRCLEYNLELTENIYQSVLPTSLKIDKTSLTMIRGNKVALKATVKPADTTEALAWSSSNKNVASISKKGVVKAQNLGKASITAACGKKAVNCSVLVNKATTLAIVGRSTSFVKFVKNISNVSSGTWSTSNASVATVSRSGTVTGKKPGVAYIKFTAKDGTVYTIDTTFENMPVTIQSRGLSNEDGYRYVEVKIQNKTNKQISWIDFDILQYDRYGRKLTPPESAYWYSRGLDPKETVTDWYYCVNRNTARVSFNITRVLFADGTDMKL